MKHFLKSLAALALVLGFSGAAFAQTLQHYEPGPRLIDGSQLNQMVDIVNGLSSNLQAVGGETALDGTNPTPVDTGLTAITSCTATIKVAVTPGVLTSVVTYDTSGGTLNLYGWMVTSDSDTTLIASTGTDTIGWSCVGN